MTKGKTTGYKTLDAFQNYWNELLAVYCKEGHSYSGACPVPRRSDVNPMKIPGLLPNIFIGDYKSEKLLEVRLSGTALDEAAGFSMKGGNYFDFCPPSDRSFLAAICKAIVQQPCGMKMNRSITLQNGRVHQSQSISLPLADSEGKPRYILGMVNIALDITYWGDEKSSQMKSETNDFSYIDIGAGIPPLPARVQGY